MEFPEGWGWGGVQFKKPSVGGVWIFSEKTQSEIFSNTACKERDVGLVGVCLITIMINFCTTENSLSGIG